MGKTVISVEHLSKRYDLGVIGTGTISRDLNRWWARTRGRPDPYLKIGQQDLSARAGEYIWALDDVSFKVEQGETLGIIGANGAGKSTLLKILSRVTGPTSGVVKIKGRVGSLLEVGTGFHAELTGRENIYLNGAILGMRRAEVDSRFDEIVDFSGVEKFIDTPVKRYSSGMYVRLAFAVAAHLQTDILIVDEVLAVGDAAFQKKCLGKMGDVASEGRTVLFVSHNMNAIITLCSKALIIGNGQITGSGNSNQMVTQYLSTLYTGSVKVKIEENPSNPIQIVENSVFGTNNEDTNIFNDKTDVKITFIVKVCGNIKRGIISMVLLRGGIPIFTAFDIDENPSLYEIRHAGYFKEIFMIPKNKLKSGMYSVTFTAAIMGRKPYQNNVEGVSFEIHETENTSLKSYAAFRAGLIRNIGSWEITPLPDTEET